MTEMTKTKHSIVFPPFASCIDAVLRIRTGLLEAAARKTDRRIILSSCLAWSLDVLGICLVRSCHLRSSFFRFLQHPCPAALRNGEAKCKRSWRQARNLLEIHWSEHHVPWHCIRVQADILHRFCFSEAFAVKACGWCRRASFFILGFDVVHAFKWRAFLMVCPPRNGRVKVMSTWCLLLNAKPSRIFESKFWALGVAQPAVFWGRSFAKLQMW